jgi:hypothetical protein
MSIKSKLFTTSFIAGAAAALYASKQMQKYNTTVSVTENNNNESYIKSSTQTPSYSAAQTAAETNNFYAKAPATRIDYNYDANTTSVTSQAPHNVYFQNDQISQPIENTTTSTTNTNSTLNNNSVDPKTPIKIDTI